MVWQVDVIDNEDVKDAVWLCRREQGGDPPQVGGLQPCVCRAQRDRFTMVVTW